MNGSAADQRPRKRDSKKDVIVAAAAEVLTRQGVAACTVRAIADRSGVSKSAIHYYFEEVDQIVELAFERIMDQFVERLEVAAAAASGPLEGLAAAAAEYLRLGADQPHGHRVPMLAFDFHVVSTRRGDTSAMERLTERVMKLFRRLAEEAGLDHAAATVDVLLSALIGAVIRSPLGHRSVEEELAVLSAALGIPLGERPRGTGSRRRRTVGS